MSDTRLYLITFCLCAVALTGVMGALFAVKSGDDDAQFAKSETVGTTSGTRSRGSTDQPQRAEMTAASVSSHATNDVEKHNAALVADVNNSSGRETRIDLTSDAAQSTGPRDGELVIPENLAGISADGLMDDGLPNGTSGEPFAETETDPATEDSPEDDESEDEGDGNKPLTQNGSLKLAGRIVNPSGRPVPGISVSVQARAADIDGVLRTLSGADGNFAFERLSAGDYLINTQATGRYTSAVQSVRAGVSSLTIVLQYRSALRVFGVVTDLQRVPLSGVSVSTPDGAIATQTDSAGRFSVNVVSETGQNTVLLYQRAGYVEAHKTIDSRSPKVNNSIQLTVQLKPAGQLSLTGSVFDRQHNPVANASITITSREQSINRYEESGDDGQFAFTDVVPAPDYLLQVTKNPEYQPRTINNIDVATVSPMSISLDPKPRGRLFGYFFNRDGTAIYDLSLTVSNEKNGVQIVTNEEGFYEVDLVSETLAFTNGSAEPQVFMRTTGVSEGEERRQDFTLDFGSNTVRGTIEDRTTYQPIVNASVSMTWQESSALSQSQVTFESETDSGGAFEFGQIGSGAWMISVSATGYQDYNQTIDPALTQELGTIQLSR